MSHEFAKKKDLPLLEHVTLPRTGALDVVMKILGPDSDQPECDKIERIVDMTVAYPGGRPLDLQSIVFGWREPCYTHVHYRSWNIKVTIKILAQQVIMILTKNYHRIYQETQRSYFSGW